MKLLTRVRADDQVDGGFDLRRASVGMLENVAINVMFADNDFVIRYVNPASMRTLKSIEHLLAVPAERVVGSSIDVFHRKPHHQRQVLAGGATRFPHKARFQLGPEWLDLTAARVTDDDGVVLGYLVNWAVVTASVNIQKEVTEATASVATAVEQMRSSIAEISSAASSSVTVADRASGSADGVTALVEQLARRTEEIDQVVAFIAGVAAQTNLLALNATIEAARAGEVGKGFAVVAGEVKDLANETDRALERIRASVTALKSDAVQARIASEGMAEQIAGVSQNSSSIAAAVEQQEAVAHEIAQQAARAADVVSR